MKRILWLIIINLIIVAILGIVTPHFVSRANLIVLVDNIALEAVVLSGYTLLLVGGYFDLSVDGIVALAGVSAGLLMTNGMIWPFASIIALTFSGMIGMFNGWVVSRVGINGLIATLTTWWICVGVSFGLTKALSPYNFPEGFLWFGQVKVLGFRSIVIYAIIIAVVLHIVLQYTKFGAHVLASGDNRQVADMMGVQTTRVGVVLYTLVGLLAGFIGLMLASRLNSASPVAVDGMALRVIAAIVIGGGRLSGGEGSIIGGLLGLLLMHILSNAIIQLGFSPYWQKAVLGGVLLTAVLVEKLRRI